MRKRLRHLSCKYDHLWGGSKVLKEWSPHYHYISISRDWVILQYLNLFRACIRALPTRKWKPLTAFLMKNRWEVLRWIFIRNYYNIKNHSCLQCISMNDTKNIDSYIFHISPNKEVVHEQNLSSAFGPTPWFLLIPYVLENYSVKQFRRHCF